MAKFFDYCYIKNWLNKNADSTNIKSVTNEPNELDTTQYLCAEELEICAIKRCNLEGQESAIPVGGFAEIRNERPSDIFESGIRDSVLKRLPYPELSKKPADEYSDGYFQKAFPWLFPSGDGCVKQGPTIDLKIHRHWFKKYLHRISLYPGVSQDIEAQFVINNMLKRLACRESANLCIKNYLLEADMPTREDILKLGIESRESLASSLLMLKSQVPDSAPFWRKKFQEVKGSIRYMEQTPLWRAAENLVPKKLMLFQTRAVPYNHHPAIHRLCPSYKKNEENVDLDMLTRFHNTIINPNIVSFMSCLMATMDCEYLSPIRTKTDYFYCRFEWGPNGNPHHHSLKFSDDYDKFIFKEHQDCLSKLDSLIASGKYKSSDFKNENVLKSLNDEINEIFNSSIKNYIEYMRTFYTNWNAGMTKEGKKTYDFSFDKRTTVAHCDMEKLIDETLTTGDFSELDDFYVKVINGTCRHVGHTGKNDGPSKKDRCATMKKVLDREAMLKHKEETGLHKKMYKNKMICKRRKPIELLKKPAVIRDLHDKRFYQLQFETNDKWFNGSDPFAILHYMHNVDDKAIVPAWLRRKPSVEFTEEGPSISLNEECEEGIDDYCCKYAIKSAIPPKTNDQLILLHSEHLQPEECINQGVVTRMLNTYHKEIPVCIFNASHINMELPLLLSNIDCKTVNITGSTLFKKNYSDDDGHYTYSTVFDKFDNRFSPNERTIKCIDENLYKKDMSIFEFSDMFTATTENTKLKLLTRRREDLKRPKLYPVRMTPHVNKSIVNPHNKYHWRFCRNMCLWLGKYTKFSDQIPHEMRIECEEGLEERKDYWISKFKEIFPNGLGLEPYAKRYYDYYNKARKEEDLTSSQESVEIENENNVIVESTNCENQSTVSVKKSFFYQDPIDMAKSDFTEDKIIEEDQLKKINELANPENVDFMSLFMKNRLVSKEKLDLGLSKLYSSDAQFCTINDNNTTTDQQNVFIKIVIDYVNKQINYDLNGGKIPDPLRLFLVGYPGCGKSFTLKACVRACIQAYGADWQKKIKLAAPTGCASYHMSFGATTIHKLFCIIPGKEDEELDVNSVLFKILCQNIDSEVRLIIIDEFSMMGRRMFNNIMSRLTQANVDVSKVGIVLVGDPAQILPIGDLPLWSIDTKNAKGKKCSKNSIEGISSFRQQFRMLPLEKISGFQVYLKSQNKVIKLKYEEKLELKNFYDNIFEGEYDVIFLKEVKRRLIGDEVSHEFVSNILRNMRYGNVSAKDMEFVRKHSAVITDLQDPQWNQRTLINGYHYFCEDEPNRKTVDSDNMHALIDYHKSEKKPIMMLKAIHLPADMHSKLMNLSSKEFGGLPSNLYLCPGSCVMLLQNIAPQFNLFNGSRHKVIGPLYLNDTYEIKITIENFLKLKTQNNLTTALVDLANNKKLRQIPIGTEILSIDGKPYNNLIDNFKQKDGSTALVCVMKIPNRPPQLPDYFIIEVENYEILGGPNILGFEDSKNWVPIKLVERTREKQSKNKRTSRITFPFEGGQSFTAFKGQGSTLDKIEIKLKNVAHTPGLFMVALSRTVSPKDIYIPYNEMPNHLDIKMQRLNKNVIDAENFERNLLVKGAETIRKYSNSWNIEENKIADLIIRDWKNNNVNYNEVDTPIDIDYPRAVILKVISKLEKTDEIYVKRPPIELDQEDKKLLENYKNPKKAKNDTRLKDLERKVPKNIRNGKRIKKSLESTSKRVKLHECIESDSPQNVRAENSQIMIHEYHPVDDAWKLMKANELGLNITQYLPIGNRCTYRYNQAPSESDKTQGDGNCYYRSIAKVITGSDEAHGIMRMKIAESAMRHHEKIQICTPRCATVEDIKTHIDEISTKDGEWATEIEVMATSLLLNTIIASFSPILPEENNYVWTFTNPRIVLNDENAPISGKIIYLDNRNAHYEPVTKMVL